MPIVGRAGVAPVSPAGAQYQPPSPGFSRLFVQPTTKYAPAPIGGTNDDQANLVAFWASLNAGDTAVFPAGATYRHSGRMGLTGATKANITIQGSLCTWIATAPSTAAFYVMDGADRVNISGITHQVSGATTRINLANDVSPFVFNNVVVGELSDLSATGSAGLGFYFWKATGYGQTLTRLTSSTTLADGIHFTNGSGGFNTADCAALDAGDDGFAHIGYLQDGAEAGRPQNINHARPYVRDSRARGISFAGARDCTATDVNIDGSLAANIYFAVERGDFNTAQTDRCTVTRGRLARAGTSYAAIPNGTNGTGLDQGAVLFLSSGNNTAVAVSDCSVSDVNIGNLAAVNYDTIRAIVYNGGVLTRNSVNNIQLYSGCPSTFVGGNTPASISPATSTDRRTEALPAYSSGSGGGRVRPTPLRKYKASSITGLADGASVSAWPEFSGGTALTQGTTGSQPAYKANAVNGKPGVDFQSSAKFLEASTPSRVQPVALMVIVDGLPGGDAQAVHHGTELLKVTSNGWVGYSGDGGTSSPAATGPQVVLFVANGTSSETYVNGSLRWSGNAGTIGFNTLLKVGLHVDGGRRWIGSILEVHEYGAVPTAAERSALHSDAQDEYGITVADYTPATVAYTGTASLSGSGSLTGSGTPQVIAAASLSGSGSLATTSTATASGSAALSGSGALSGAGAPQTSGAASLSGAGSLTATGVAGQSGTATLSGSGQLTGSGTPSITGAASLSGNGSLTASGVAAESGTATAALAGNGTLTATGTPRFSNAVTFTGTGTLSSTGQAAASGSAALNGAGMLNATGLPRYSGTAALSGTGTLAVVSAAQLSAAANLDGLGTLTAGRLILYYISHTYGASGIAAHLSTAALFGDGVSAALLASDGTGTAVIAAHLSTASINTDTL